MQHFGNLHNNKIPIKNKIPFDFSNISLFNFKFSQRFQRSHCFNFYSTFSVCMIIKISGFDSSNFLSIPISRIFLSLIPQIFSTIFDIHITERSATEVRFGDSRSIIKRISDFSKNFLLFDCNNFLAASSRKVGRKGGRGTEVAYVTRVSDSDGDNGD